MLGLVINGSVCEGCNKFWAAMGVLVRGRGGGMTACKWNDLLDLVTNGSVCEGCNKCWTLSPMGVFVRAVIHVGPYHQWKCL